MRYRWIAALAILVAVGGAPARAETHVNDVIFDGGPEGYHSYRIPALVRTKTGTLIAFAERRTYNNRDYGDINLVFKRSTNNGDTWSPLGEVAGIGPGTWGNPTAVAHTSGRVWVFMNWNDANHNQGGTDGLLPIDDWGERRVYVSYSDDDGLTWNGPFDQTAELLPPYFEGTDAFDVMGPGAGIQTKFFPPGRLVIPATERMIYTDNNWNWFWVPVQPVT